MLPNSIVKTLLNYNSKRLLFSGSNKWMSTQGRKLHGVTRFIRWTPIPLGIGFALIGYQQYRHVKKSDENKIGSVSEPYLAKDWELTCYRLVPLRTVSRIWGWVNSIELPVWAREPVLNLYAKSFGVNVDEAEDNDLTNYRNLGEFFRRGLKPEARTIHPGDCVVSPSDGTVTSCGRVNKCRLEQIKGVTYTLDSFLGRNTWISSQNDNLLQCSESEYHESLMSNPIENDLFHCVVYLAPGDYHRFHSPVDWEISFRRHFTGDLLSVKPNVARWIPGLFTLNERAVYVGRWKHGFFAFAAVGATNVGSIRIHIDKELQTNSKQCRKGSHRDFSFSSHNGGLVRACKGELFGEFNLGSTVVLVFEAPRGFQFNVQPGDRIHVGEPLNVCREEKHHNHAEKLKTRGVSI